MSMNKTINMFIAFVAIFVIAFFAIGFTSTVQAPTNATALAQYNNLTQVTDIANTGVNAVMLLIIAAMVIASIMVLMATKRR